MTTAEDWTFRASYLRKMAGEQRARSANILIEADNLCALAGQCDAEAARLVADAAQTDHH